MAINWSRIIFEWLTDSLPIAVNCLTYGLRMADGLSLDGERRVVVALQKEPL